MGGCNYEWSSDNLTVGTKKKKKTTGDGKSEKNSMYTAEGGKNCIRYRLKSIPKDDVPR